MEDKKVVIIGIDGMDRELIEEFKDELPTISKLKELSPIKYSESVFPPDSETAWASIYTGLNPAKHGIVLFLDPLEKSIEHQTKDPDNTPIRGKTFWDIAGKYNKKVCILLPHVGYPVWEVNGIMVGRSSVIDDVQTYPENLDVDFDLSRLNTIKGFPGKGGLSHEEFVKRHEELLEATLEFSKKVFEKEEWDIFFVYTSILDVVPHFFWKYHDKDDPAYPMNNNSYKDVIRNFYRMHDEFIREFYKKIDDDTVFIVLSDHGHGRRPVENVNINELLRQKGLLKDRKKHVHTKIIEFIKKEAMKIVSKYHLENYASLILKKVPQARKLYVSPPAIDWTRTIAYVSDLSGIKSYPYGGIRINRELISDEKEYEKIRDEIINMLQELRHPKTGQKLVMWIKRREELYDGPYINKYPDIVFELDENFGIGNRVNAPLIEKSHIHTVVPGSHKRYNAVFYIIGDGIDTVTDKITLMNIAPSILNMLGIDWRRYNMDGMSIVS